MNAPVRSAIFALGPHIRYVAFGSGQRVDTDQREDVRDASSSASDFYEQLLVNPTLLTLVRQRGELDCGGLRYSSSPTATSIKSSWVSQSSHVSVCAALEADPVEVATRVSELLGAAGTDEPASAR